MATSDVDIMNQMAGEVEEKSSIGFKFNVYQSLRHFVTFENIPSNK